MKTYIAPEIEILTLDSQDIIATSGLTMKGVFDISDVDDDFVWDWNA